MYTSLVCARLALSFLSGANSLDGHTYYCYIRIIYSLDVLIFLIWLPRLFFPLSRSLSISYFSPLARVGKRRGGPGRAMHGHGGFSLLRSAHGEHDWASWDAATAGFGRASDGNFRALVPAVTLVLPSHRQLLDFVCTESNDSRPSRLHRVRFMVSCDFCGRRSSPIQRPQWPTIHAVDLA